MHMSDALLSPSVGITFCAISGAILAFSAKKVSREEDTYKTPLMAVTGAFIFASQMINFSIPGTGSSGHIGGGLLLSILLGPHRAFITLASVLTLQALFFADGGILALGANVFNLAFFPAFIAYPLIFKSICGDFSNKKRMAVASVTAAVVGLLFGSFFVILQTVASGNSELPFKTFVLFMLPIHFVIGIVEGIVTLGVISFIRSTQPALLMANKEQTKTRIVLSLMFAAILVGGVFSLFASSSPDGLEWSIARVTGSEEISGSENIIASFATKIQEKMAFLPDYGFRGDATSTAKAYVGTSLSGLLGAMLVGGVLVLFGFLIRKRNRKMGNGCC
ncbi:MAG: energy-coupling factor ABC transporter permease [Fibrobacteres bacterium]|nr:energy-coupling factor ABC transporter permease [Fibrobacterota bacterium]